MNGRMARKGDRALVLRSELDKPDDRFVGTIICVSSDPYTACEDAGNHSRHWGRLVNDIQPAGWYAETRCLIPLPPDAEAKRLFADEPVGVGA